MVPELLEIETFIHALYYSYSKESNDFSGPDKGTNRRLINKKNNIQLACLTESLLSL